MVRLAGAYCHQRPGSAGERIAAQKLEFSGLVSTAPKARQIITLDPKTRPTLQSRANLQGGWQRGEQRSLEMIEHYLHARQGR